MTEPTIQATFESQEWIVESGQSSGVTGSEDLCGSAEIPDQGHSGSVANSLPLLPLTKDTSKGGPTYAFEKALQSTLQDSGFGDVLYLDFAVDPPYAEQEVPLLMATDLTHSERPEARHPRKISWTPKRGARVHVPPRLLNAQGTAEIGLGLDLSSYSNDNRLLFRIRSAETCISFQPIRYEQGRQYTYTGGKQPLI